MQILECLHPIDLYNVIRTTKTLRSLLLSKSASKIWERCFLAYPDIPFYPKDVSPSKWASLLFATGICDVSLRPSRRTCLQWSSSMHRSVVTTDTKLILYSGNILVTGAGYAI